MIVYFDTSAAIPLLVDGPGTEICRHVWGAADAVVTTRLLFVETAAALAQAERMGRLSADAHQAALAGLELLWQQFEVVELTELLMRSAADLARQHRLRGHDAVHCAAAGSVAGPTTVAVTGERTLLTAWQTIGLSVVDART